MDKLKNDSNIPSGLEADYPSEHKCVPGSLADNVSPENSEFLSSIIHTIPVGLAYFEDLRMKWVNQKFLDMFLFAHTTDYAQLFSSDIFDSEDEYRRVIRLLLKTIRSGANHVTEARFRRQDGTVFIANLNISISEKQDPFKGIVFAISDVTQHVESAHDANEKESMLRHVLAASPIGIARVNARKFVWINDSFIKMFRADNSGYFVGKSTRIIYGSDEEFERIGQLLYWNYRSGTESEITTRLIRKDGSEFDAFIKISAPDPRDLTKETIATVTDISRFREAELAIKLSESRFRDILENIRLTAICLDLDANVSFCNGFFLELVGMTHKDVIGRNWFDTFVPIENQRLRRNWHEKILNGTITSHEQSKILTSTGERRHIAWNHTLLKDYNGTIIGIASIGQDVTDTNRANELLLETERMKAVGEMASAVAHNFNNLLQITMGACQLAQIHLELGNLHQIKARLTQIEESSKIGAQTLKRLQEFARIRDDVAVSKSSFDLCITIAQSIEMAKPFWKTNPEHEKRNIEVITSLEEDCFIIGNEGELFEVFINLIKNASEAMPNGGKINISCKKDDQQITCLITDSGTGIEKSDVRRIFQPFWTTKGKQGTGLGLASSHAIITRHKGTIQFQSAVGEGTEFTILLPLAKKSRQRQDVRKTDHNDPHFTILLVDDMESVLNMLEFGLIEYGHTVLTASNGDLAIEIFKNNHVDVVVCDLGMDGMSGWEVSKAVADLCTQRKIPKIPFIILTGWASQIKNSANVAENFVDQVIPKPISVPELLQELRQIILKFRQKYPCN